MAAYAALVSVMNIIDNLQLHPRPPISLDKKQVHILTEKVTFLQEFLEHYNPNLGYSTEADPLEILIADAAYAAEDAIESRIVDHISNDGENMSSDSLYEALEKVIEDMAWIERKAMKIKETFGFQNQFHIKSTPQDSSRSSSSSPSVAHMKSTMVGVEDLLLEMKSKLTADGRDLQIIPIVGMGGSGKTTLALNIYQDRLIKEHFDICAWATISQEYNIREILVQLLTQLIEEFDEDSSEAELGEMLRKHIYGRKYIIILDDMWSIKAWDRVKWFLPDNNTRSRIVITTRLSNLASDLSGSKSLEMELLDEANSWNLLSKTAFGEKGYPLELEETGKRIGLSCKGLPLSIVVVGGLLAKSKHTREFWEYIEGNLNSVVNLEDDERCLKILYMSYKQLPVHLKPCFLYMGVYPEDMEILTSKLIKLWVAEGFLKPISGKSLEEVATLYLKELIDRNLVLRNKVGSIGNIKECKIHDLLRELCLREAQKEHFLTVFIPPRKFRWRELLSDKSVMNKYRELKAYWFGGEPLLQGVVDVQRRVVFSRNGLNALTSSNPEARSMVWDVEYQALQLRSFKLLRILESRGRQSPARAEFLTNLSQLVNSRFLEISAISSGCKFPNSIWLFWNLQTLIVGHTWEVTAPVDIWCMPRIKHIKFHFLHFRDPPTSQGDGNVLGNLQSLGVMKYFECSEQVVKRVPNIKKLQIFYEGLQDKHCLSNLCCLDKLESLRCQFTEEINGSVKSLISFPHSLKKLTLKVDGTQCWEEILDKIGVLPHLQKLQLESGTFIDRTWETSEGHFPSLKFLLLRECLGLHFWTAESSHFPCLEHLVIDQTWNLTEIPLEFSDISTLRVIKMIFPEASAVESAKRILEEQEALYGEEETSLRVQVRISSSLKAALEGLASPNFCFV